MFGIQEKETYEKDRAYGVWPKIFTATLTVYYNIDFTGK